MASNARPYWDPEDSDKDTNVWMVTVPVASLNASSRSSDAFKPLNLSFGDLSKKDTAFVPFKLVRAYPHKYVGRANQSQVVQIFEQTLLKDRVWDFFLQRDPSGTRAPLLLVPTIQFEQFLIVVNHQINGELTIPRGSAEKRFSLMFGEWDTPRPRFLGRANNARSLEALAARDNALPDDELSHLSHSAYQMYQDKMDEIYSSLKSRKSKKKQEAAKEKKKESSRMLKRVQRYLGLRRALSHVSLDRSTTTDWDVLKPAPFEPRESVRFICVDIEAYEKDTRVVTEIGLAVLDTEDLINTCPGERGENWFSLVQAYHFRIQERCYMVNSEYVQGCPEAFNFGESQIVSIKHINKIIGEIIGDEKSEDQRPVIIVGHQIEQDLKYLMRINYNAWSASLIVDEIDTQQMFRRIERNPNARGLATMCAELGIPGNNFHNGGNDAVYTLRAMITMAIKQKVEGSDRDEQSFTPGTDDWTDGDMDDGGCAKRSDPPVEKNRTPKDQYGHQHVQW
ncbi:hypothetical protein F5Y03DRAFT_389951 [Xylaria venustula]|nr:hypothetical protein F5Y03DRAFT_389951 [Xylaria venustula]